MKLVTFEDQWKKGWEEIKIYKKAFYHSDKLARITKTAKQIHEMLVDYFVPDAGKVTW